MRKLEPEDPEKIGPFEIVARLGAGGMGVVFLGTRGVERYAVKVVRRSYLDSPDLKSRFLREIETLKKLNSPLVARLVDSGIEKDLAWHAVEFVNGPNLREFVEANGPLENTAWWALAGQLQVALSDIHSVGIVHRDLKPSNIVMSELGIKIIDFGIAHDNEATSLTTTGLVAGSPAWLSPEQLEGTELSQASDLFSAGSVLVFAATGKSPWGQETTMSVPVLYRKILEAKPSLEGMSHSQQMLISGLMEADPRDRKFLSIGELEVDKTPLAKTPKSEFARTESIKLSQEANYSFRASKRHGVFALIVLVTIACLVIVSAVASSQAQWWSAGPSQSERADNRQETSVTIPAEFAEEEQYFIENRCLIVLGLLDEATSILRSLRSFDFSRDTDGRLDGLSSEIREISYELPIGSSLATQIRRAGDTFAGGNRYASSPARVLSYLEVESEKVRTACSAS